MIETIRHFLGNEGRLLSGSKSLYRERHPDGRPVFNCNLFVENEKAWHGDVDLVTESDTLQQLANALGKSVYIFTEHPYRWMKDEDVKLEEAIATYTPNND